MRGFVALLSTLALLAVVSSHASALNVVGRIDRELSFVTYTEQMLGKEDGAKPSRSVAEEAGEAGGSVLDEPGDAETQFEMCSASGNVEVAETEIDAPVRSFHWAQKDRNIVYVLSSNGTVYKSHDEGSTWTNEMEHMEHSQEILQRTGIYRMHGVRDLVFSADDSKVWFLSNGNYYWTCEGEKDEYSVYAIEDTLPDVSAGQFRIDRIVPHPVLPHLALLNVIAWDCYPGGNSKNCHTRLFLTQDFGKKFELVDTYVYNFDWGASEETFFYNHIENGKGGQGEYHPWEPTLVVTRDLGASTDKKYSRVPAFVYNSGILFAGMFQDNTADHFSLWASMDEGAHLTRTVFGSAELDEHSYVILENDEGASFINVQHDDNRWGTLYTADTVDAIYVESLEKNKRNQRMADFVRVEGIDGVYIANYYDLPLALDIPEEEQMNGDEVERKIRTVITVDQGSEFFTLDVPINVPCSEEHCSLHLFGPTQSEFSSVYSKKNAVGLVLASGNVGEFQQSREDTIGTYLSRDAGVSWELVRAGEYAYAMGDHGAIMVMVSLEELVSTILYSWNEGLLWNECSFSDVMLDATTVVAEPTAASQKFIVYGTRTTVDEGIRGVLIHVDFTGLHERQCVGADRPGTEGSDYELWVPSFAGDCILGERVAYVRRNRTSKCFNGLAYESHHVLARCPCTISDYICDDVCFNEVIQISGVKECVNICEGGKDDPTVKPEECEDTYTLRTGYTLVGEDNCNVEAGLNLLPVTLPCKEKDSSDGSNWLLVLSILFVIIGLIVLVTLVGGGAYLFMTNEAFRERVEPFLEKMPGFGAGGAGPSYSMVSGDTGSLLDDYDDAGIGIVDDGGDDDDDDVIGGPVEAFGASIRAQKLSELPDESGDIPPLDGPSDRLIDM